MREKTTVGTLIEAEGKVLFLLRSAKEKRSPRTWGIAAGGKEGKESDRAAAVREIREETGLKVRQKDLEALKTYHWQVEDLLVHFPAFRLRQEKMFTPALDPEEHDGYAWMSPEECLSQDNLIHGLSELVRETYGCEK